jgi:hypothetical protein
MLALRASRCIVFPLSITLKLRAMSVAIENLWIVWESESAGADRIGADLLHGTFWLWTDQIRLTHKSKRFILTA